MEKVIATRSVPNATLYATLLLRIGLGLLFLAHAAVKVFVFTVPGFLGYFASLGLPAVFAYATLALEVAGGLCLVLGIYAPLICLPLAGELMGTIVMEHGKHGFVFSNSGGGWEFPALWALALIVLSLLGDGPLALRPMRRGSIWSFLG